MNRSRRRFLQVAGFGVASIGVASRGFGLALRQSEKRPAAAAGVVPPVQTLELEKDLHVITGPFGNVGVYAGEGAALVVDCGTPDKGKEVFAAAGKLTGDAKRKLLFNTHWHFDHVGGNGPFAADGYCIVGSGPCRRRLSETIVFEDLGMTFQPLPESDRPTVTFDKEMTLYGPSDVKVAKVAPAHTDTDAYVVYVKHNVLQTGDLFFNGAFPVIDRSTGGSLDGMIAASQLLLGIVGEGTRIIPGHGPMARKPDLQAQLDLLKTVRDRLAPWGEKKTAMDEVLAKKPLADLDDKWGRGFVRSELFTKMAYGQWLAK